MIKHGAFDLLAICEHMQQENVNKYDTKHEYYTFKF